MDPTPVITPEKKLSLDILAKAKTAQLANGLRHGDYNRYKNYCTRRVRRIHKKLKFFDKPQGGQKHQFRPKVVTPALVTDVRFLELVLVMAERSWAHGMALRDVVEPRAKFHSARRFTKAAKWASQLEKLCDAKADERTILEANSYYAWLSANILFQKENWKEAHEKFIKARAIYSELSKTCLPEHQEFFKDKITEIDPSIRYCTFNLKGETLPDESTIIEPFKQRFEAVLLEAASRPVKTPNVKQTREKKPEKLKPTTPHQPAKITLAPPEPVPAPAVVPVVQKIEPKPLEPVVIGKPLLFDLALSQCTFPDLTERKKPPKGGFFSSWWG